jgi:magnesium transporter
VPSLTAVDLHILVADRDGDTTVVDSLPDAPPDGGWVWVDIVAGPDDVAELLDLTDRLRLDRLAVRDAVVDVDLPKTDDFGHHLLVVLHGLSDRSVTTYEVDCFLTDDWLITVHDTHAVSVPALWNQVRHRPDLARATIDEITGLLADVMTRRLLSVLEAFDERVEGLTAKALTADTTLLEELTAVRTDLAGVRRVVKPQREALDVLRHSTSDLVSDAGRRRFSDVFDVASRLAAGLDEARSALAETLDAYRGAEARQATEVTKVLTVYAAIMLPLSLIAGIFGMNFVNLPLLDRRAGWAIVAALMLLVAFVSLGVFISLGWIRRPSGRRTGAVLGRGLVEASRAPVQIVGAVVEMSTMPLRATGTMLRQAVDPPASPRRRPGDDRNDRDERDDEPNDDAAHHGSE